MAQPKKNSGLAERAKALAQVEDFRSDNVLVQIREKSTTVLTLFNRLLEPLAEDADKPITLGDVQRIRGLMDSWIKLIEFADKKLDEVQRRHLELELSPDARKEYDRVKADLRDQYEGKGPQYELLIESVARIHVYLAEMFKSGRMYSLDELQDLGKLELGYIEQLQSRTESSKFEVMELQVNEVSLRILHLVRRRVTAETLALIIGDVKAAIATTGSLLEGPIDVTPSLEPPKAHPSRTVALPAGSPR